MEKQKAELVDRLNVINQRIQEQGYGVDKNLLEIRDKILKELDLFSKKDNNGGN